MPGLDTNTKLLIHANGGVAAGEYAQYKLNDTGSTVADAGSGANNGTAVYATTNLLINFDGADGAVTYTAETGQTVSFVGTAQLDDAQKKFGATSLLLDGNSDYCTVPDEASWDLLDGSNFTLDCWVRFSSVGQSSPFMSQWSGGSGTYIAWRFYWEQPTSKLTFMAYDYNGGYRDSFAECSFSPSINTWYHVAVVRSGANAYMFINGVSQSVTFDAWDDTIGNPSSVLYIGYEPANSYYMPGWIDSPRIIRAAKWVSDFAVPDKNPVLNSMAYLGKVGTGSLAFNGSSEYVNVDSLFTDVASDTKGTICGWVNVTSGNGFVMAFGDTNANAYIYLGWTVLGSKFRPDCWAGVPAGTYWGARPSTFDYDFGTWYHLALVQDGIRPKVYVNGVDVTNLTTTTDTTKWIGGVAGLDNGRLGVLHYNNSDIYWVNGRFDDVRYYQNIALSQEAINTLYNSGSGTDNSLIIDSSASAHVITAYGDTKITPAVTNPSNAKLASGGGIAQFNGTSAYLSIPDSADWFFDDGTAQPFTIEFWTYLNAGGDVVFQTSGAGGTLILQGVAVSPTTIAILAYDNNKAPGGYQFVILSSVSISVHAWHHIAIVRVDGSNSSAGWRMFLDGVSQSLTLSTGSWDKFTSDSSGVLLIGYRSDIASYFSGYIDEFRISKGIARYTSNFTPSIRHTADSYTKLLLHFDSDVTTDSETTPKTVTNNNVVWKAGSKWNSGSLDFDGTGDYLSIPDSADWDVVGSNTDSWTVDSQVSFKSPSGQEYLINHQADGNNGWFFGNTSGSALRFEVWSGGVAYTTCDAPPISDSIWHHLSVCKVGVYYGLYVDGVQKGYTWSTYTNTFTGPMSIGAFGAGSAPFEGNMDEIRVQKSNYFLAAPNSFPAAPLISYGDSLKQSYAKFNGSSAYLSMPNSQDWTLRTGNWTIDFWMKLDTLADLQTIVAQNEDATNYWAMFKYSADTRIRIYYVENNVTRFDYDYYWNDFSVNQWYHIAWTYDGSTVRLFINGVSVTLNTNTVIGDLTAIVAPLTIGYGSNPAKYFDGSIDEFRWSKGVARWTSNFTPPTSRYTSDANTQLLLHFDDSLTLDSGDRIASTDIDDEDMADISDWTDMDAGTGASTQVTFDSKSCMKLDSGGTAGDGNYAARIQDVGTFGTRTVVSASIYCDNIGTNVNRDLLSFVFYNGSYACYFELCSDGLFHFSNPDYVEVGTNLVVLDTWQEWTFDINWPALNVDVYLDKTYRGSAKIGYASATANGTIRLISQSFTIANVLSYVDWIRVGTTLGHTVTNNNVTAEINNAGFGDKAVPSGTAGARRPAPVLLTNFNGADEEVLYVAETGQTVTFVNDAELDTSIKKYGNSALILNDDPTNLILLIHFNGADAATTHTAATGQTVTFVGNAQLDTAQKKFGTASLLLDGTGDNVTVPDSDQWNFAGDYTVEFWIRFNALPATGDITYVMSQYVDSTHYAGIFVQESGGSYYMGYRVRNGGDQGFASKDIPSLSTGVWYHMAYVRDYANSLITYYLNGTSIGTNGYPQSYGNFAAPLSIGRLSDVGVPGINGWIDDFVVNSGIKKYTANFTPPTSRIGYQSYATVPDSDTWNFGSGDFTIDCWTTLNAYPSAYAIIYSQRDDGNNQIIFGFQKISSSYYLIAYCYNTAAAVFEISNVYSFSLNTWYHLALVRSGNSMRMFVDGVQIGTTATVTGSVKDLASSIAIGEWINNLGSSYNGWIDDFRITKGIALWTANFTPPASGATLLNTPNATKLNSDTCLYFDGNSDYLTVTDTSGTDYDMAGSTTDSWTIDGWFLTRDLSANNQIYEQTDSSPAVGERHQMFINGNGALDFRFQHNGAAEYSNADSASGLISANRWYHLTGIVHQGHTGCYINGVQVAYVKRTWTDTFTGSLYIGYSPSTPGYYFNGYMEQLQITHANKFGVIPMPAPYTQYKLNDNTTTTTVVDSGTGANDGTSEVGVTLQCNFNGADGATAYTAETGQVATFFYNAQLDTADKKYGSASMLFDAVGDRITFPTSANWQFGTGNFTIACWAKFNNLPAGGTKIICAIPFSNEEQWACYYDVDTKRLGIYSEVADVPYVGSVVLTSPTALATGVWYHLAVVRDAGVIKSFVNGVLQGSVAFTATFHTNANDLNVGTWTSASGAESFDGWMDDLIIIKGSARWIETFTPPTSQLTIDCTNYLSVPGKVSTAFRFARREIGVAVPSDYIILDNLIADIKTDTTGSFSFWAKIHTDEGVIFSASDASANYYMTIFPDGSGHIGMNFNHNSVNQWVAYTTATFTLDTWFHFAVVHNGTTPVFYFNGVESTNITTSTDLTYWFNDASAYYDKCSIGIAYRFTSGDYVSPSNCSIDDFRYYQNTVLNATQVGYLYAAGVGTERTYGENDLVVPTAVLTQNTITVPTQEYGPVVRAKNQAISIIL